MKQDLEKFNLEIKEKFNTTYNELKKLKELCSNYDDIKLIKQKYCKLKNEMKQDYNEYKKLDSNPIITPISLRIYLDTMYSALAKGMKAPTNCNNFLKLKESIFIAFDEFDYTKSIENL